MRRLKQRGSTAIVCFIQQNCVETILSDAIKAAQKRHHEMTKIITDRGGLNKR
jgi:hypothetical protein